MLKAAILFAVGAVTLATLAPSFVPDSSPIPAQRPAVAETVAPPDEAPPRSSGYREAILKADPRGQYAADALVNGSPVRMLVDTGASVVVLSAATAARLGVSTGGAKWRMKTANGETEASPVTLDAISFGGLVMTGVQAVVLPRAAGDADLLGATFLKRLISVEQRDGLLIVRQ
jgi:aspartyl protease family protein